jgi:hypothetical protein
LSAATHCALGEAGATDRTLDETHSLVTGTAEISEQALQGLAIVGAAWLSLEQMREPVLQLTAFGQAQFEPDLNRLFSVIVIA